MHENLKEAIDKAQRIVFFSGAGMSTASGIPDFRSQSGLYKNVYRAEEMVSHSAFTSMTDDFYIFFRFAHFSVDFPFIYVILQFRKF